MNIQIAGVGGDGGDVREVIANAIGQRSAVVSGGRNIAYRQLAGGGGYKGRRRKRGVVGAFPADHRAHKIGQLQGSFVGAGTNGGAAVQRRMNIQIAGVGGDGGDIREVIANAIGQRGAVIGSGRNIIHRQLAGGGGYRNRCRKRSVVGAFPADHRAHKIGQLQGSFVGAGTNGGAAVQRRMNIQIAGVGGDGGDVRKSLTDAVAQHSPIIGGLRYILDGQGFSGRCNVRGTGKTSARRRLPL